MPAACTRPQRDLLSAAFGLAGSGRYTGRAIAAVHSTMIKREGLGAAEFDSYLGHLQESLRELGKEEAQVQEVAGLMVSQYRALFSC